MKKILIFSLAYYPRVGGAEVAIKEITSRISDIEFHMVTLRFDNAPLEERVGNVQVHRVGTGSYLSKMFFAFTATRRGLQLHRARNFDGVWAMMSYMLLPIVLLRVCGVNLPYALTLQEGDTYGHMFGRLRVVPFLPLLNFGFRNAAVVQAISTYLGTWARKRGFKEPLEIIPNGVDTKHFAGERVPHEGVVLITASRLVSKNGLDIVIQALPHVPEVRFVVLGTGPQERELVRLATELQVAARVEFVGHVDHAQLPARLHGADIFVRPSRSEGMGNAFIEAFAAGLPVVATQEGGIADFLFDAKRNPAQPTTGWAVDANSPEQVAQAVRDIIANPEAAKRVTETARRLALKKYDWDLIARAMRERVFAPLFYD
jgi:glycosyltransferase involved in cell wall biosynthesis